MTENRLCVTSPRTFWGSYREHLVSLELAYSRKNKQTNKPQQQTTSKQAKKQQQRNKLPQTENEASKIKQKQQRPQQTNEQTTTKIKYFACLKLLVLRMVSVSVSSQTAAISNFRGYRK